VLAMRQLAPRDDGFRLTAVAQLPYEGGELLRLDDPARRVDADGVQLYERDGTRFLHPVGTAQYALAALAGYHRTGDGEYLRRARANAEALLGTARTHEDAIFFPYPFDFPLGDEVDNTIHAPWYSGMAQGQALSLFVRLWEVDHDQRWRTAADRTFRSFEVERGPGHPWVTLTDDERHVWFEEYAGDTEPLLVLNGHNFALYGLYDYHRVTGSEDAARLFSEGATTVRDELAGFRVPGGVSYYCLQLPGCRRPLWQNPKYHAIHAEQLAALADITDDPWFAERAAEFRADHS
ncbi:D-glucuronyl C5-epimerase family protein, partial [Kineococcus glutinatus]|uniref:D-glucuronyl C5-epimerase family protein n=1 Tax=Kineococcus glutinatus TaxID=1070872 RepID=UPI0031F0ED43